MALIWSEEYIYKYEIIENYEELLTNKGKIRKI